MAEPVLLDDLKFWHGGYALEGDKNNVNLTLKNTEKPDGRFGDGLEVTYPGLLAPELTANGFYRSAADGLAPDNVLAARAGLSGTQDRSSWPTSLCPPSAPGAAGADGNLAYTIEGAHCDYTIGAQHGELLPYSFRKKPRSLGRVYRQTIVLPRAVRSATSTGTGRQLGAVAASQQLVCVLHVFAVTGGTWTLTVESDDNAGFSSAVVRLTMAGATGITREVKKLAGAITDDWWRVVLTKSGGTSCDAAALLSVSPL